MADCEDQNQQHLVVDLIQDAEIAGSQAVDTVFDRQQLHARRSWIIG